MIANDFKMIHKTLVFCFSSLQNIFKLLVIMPRARGSNNAKNKSYSIRTMSFSKEENKSENTNKNQNKNTNTKTKHNKNNNKSLSGQKRSYMDLDDYQVANPPLKKQRIAKPTLKESEDKEYDIGLQNMFDAFFVQIEKEIQKYKDKLNQLQVDTMQAQSECKSIARQLQESSKTIEKQAEKIKELKQILNIP